MVRRVTEERGGPVERGGRGRALGVIGGEPEEVSQEAERGQQDQVEIPAGGHWIAAEKQSQEQIVSGSFCQRGFCEAL